LPTARCPIANYFDHHTPLLHFLLAPLVGHFDVASSPDDAVELVSTARRAMWVLGALILLFTALVGSRYRAAWWA